MPHTAWLHELTEPGNSWNTTTCTERRVHDQHTEFTMGCAWALFEQDLIADCSWDEEVHVYKA